MPSPDPSSDVSYRPVDEVLDRVRSDAGRRIDEQARRRRRTARIAGGGVVAVALVAGAVAVGTVLRDGDGDPRASTSVGTSTSVTSDTAPPETVPGPSGGESLPMAASPLSGRSRAITAWTGSELLVWRGQGAFSDTCTIVDDAAVCGDPTRTDGARYDPATDTWHPMAESPMPPEPGSSMASTVGVWTGTELVVWGGPGPDAAAYDPATDTWRTLDPGPLVAREGAAAVWTGDEVVIVGGVGRRTYGTVPVEGGDVTDLANAALDPATGTWRELPVLPDGYGTWEVHAVWTGSEVAVVLPSVADTPGWIGSLDVEGGRWRALPARPGPQVERLATFTALVATDDRLVAIGRLQYPPGTDARARYGAEVFDLDDQTWSGPLEFSAVGEPRSPGFAIAVGGGEVLVPFSSDFAVPEDGPADLAIVTVTAAPDPQLQLSEIPGLAERTDPAMAWTGSALLVWGGEVSTGYTSEQLEDGVRYRPS